MWANPVCENSSYWFHFSVHAKSLQSCPTGWLPIPWMVAHQASLSVGFFRQEYWSGYWSTLPPPGHLPGPGIKPVSLMSSALVGRFFTTSNAWLQRIPIHTRLQLQLASQAPQCLLWSSKPQSLVVVNHCQHTYFLYTTSCGVSPGEVSSEPAETQLYQL